MPDVFNNAGTFTKSVTTGTTTIEAEFNNSGTANILTGTLSLSGGGTEGGGISLSSGTALVISGSIATFQNTSILSGGGSVTFSGGTATFNSGATYDPTGTTTVSGGTVNFNSSNVSITGPLKISAGTANLATGGSNITPSSITISGGVLTGSDTITTPAAVSWTGGSIGASGSTEILNATAGMSIVANAELSFPGGTINNTGVATWTGTGGYIYAFGANAPGKNTTFNNESSANFDVQSDEIYYGNGSQATVPDVFNNAGTFTKSVTTGTTTIEAEFNNSGTANILTGTLSLSGGGTEGGGISLSSGTALVISGSIATFQNTSILSGGGSVTFSGGTATFNSGATYDPTGTTTVSGGTVNFNSSSVSITGPLKISAGTANLATGGSNITPSSITISGGGKLNATNGHFFIDYGANPDPIAAIAGYIKTGYSSGAWNGLGIDSSVAAVNPHYGLGYADSADQGNPANLSSDQIEVKYTLYGDANLDGVVNGTDFGIMAAHFGQQVSGWDQGDFNYDGVVNGSDFGLLAANFGQQANGAVVELPSSDWAALDSFAAANNLLADVPEPAAFGLIVLAGIGAIGQRRRRPGIISRF